ncbi:MAG: hypothetical protein HZA53_00345 [Planctomycetes bacterium]|nr:hypothetical protein [Planctomycetota bacterium]
MRERPPELHLERGCGVRRIGPGELPGFESVRAACGELLERARPLVPRMQAAAAGKSQLTLDLFSDDLHARDRRFVDFALQDSVLLPVVEYLRTAPFLARLSLPLSLHVPGLPLPSYQQRFHLDNDDFRLVKLIVNLEDVDDDDGPFTFLPEDVTRRVLSALRRENGALRRSLAFDDADVFRHADPSELQALRGPPGSAILVDGARCLHYGSRVKPGRQRPVLGAVYLRHARLCENSSSQFDPPGEDLDPLRKRALRSPRPRPRGYFLRDVLADAEASASRSTISSNGRIA